MHILFQIQNEIQIQFTKLYCPNKGAFWKNNFSFIYSIRLSDSRHHLIVKNKIMCSISEKKILFSASRRLSESFFCFFPSSTTKLKKTHIHTHTRTHKHTHIHTHTTHIHTHTHSTHTHTHTHTTPTHTHTYNTNTHTHTHAHTKTY
jgi:hypothetical protein